MKKSIALLYACLLAWPSLFASGADLSRTQSLGAAFFAAQKKAVAAADAFAAALYPRNSPQYAATFRQALNQSYAPSIINSPQATAELLQHNSTITNALRDLAGTEMYQGAPFLGLGAPQSAARETLLDRDPRYLVSLSALQGGASIDRILGGLPTSGYLNTVVVRGGTSLCSGVVVGRRAILTAQHCFCAGVDEDVYVGSAYSDQAIPYKVARGVAMKACTSPVTAAADIAVLFMQTPFDANVLPAPFAPTQMIDATKVVRAVGFGLTELNYVGQKMMVDIPVASSDCSGHVSIGGQLATDGAYYGCNPQFELVAGSPLLNRDTCKGDSGGPVFIRDSLGQDYLAGTTSRSVSTPGARPCGDGGIYVRTDGQVLAWIRSQGALQ